jgi:hypothetical protein
MPDMMFAYPSAMQARCGFRHFPPGLLETIVG